jgi:hypothetical protein
MLPVNRPGPWYRRLGCGGCLLALLFGLALLFAVVVILNPWAVHIGGSPTPLLHWDGYGEGVTPAGTPVIVAVSLGPRFEQGSRSICFGCGNVSGSGELCTPNADINFRSLSGNLHTYWSTDGARITVQLYRASGAARGFELDLQGSWHGNTFAGGDQSILYEHVNPDGHFHLSYTAAITPQITTLQIHSGSHDAFKAACRRLSGG